MGRIVSWVTEYSYRKAWLVILAVVMVVGFGGYTITQVQQELIPDIEFPQLTIIAVAPEGQPGDIAAAVTIPIENATGRIEGLKSTESTTVAGLSVVTLQFPFGQDLNAAEQAVQDALVSARLAPDVSTSILKFDPSILPIVTFSVRGDLSQSELLAIAQNDVIPELRAIDGVASAEVVGGAVQEIVVTLDRAAMLDAGVTYDNVATALQSNNVILPSGDVATEGTVVPLDVVAVFSTLDDIRSVVVAGPDGPVVLSEIATVEVSESTSVGSARTDGQPAVAIRVAKEKNANTVTTAHAVTDRLEELDEVINEAATIDVFEDQSEFITESISGVIEEGLIGGVLAIIIVFLFLSNWRTTLVTAVSIPLSIIAAIILLDQMGYSLNIMTLGGLTIAIGRVIDDSIVVLENVYRHMAQGESTFPAIINGAREVTIAIVGATATTCAVFLPLGMTGGLIGQLFLSFSLAVVFALLASLVVAVTVIPVLARFTLGGKVKVEREKRAADTRLARLYTPILTLSLRHRWKTLGIAGGAFVASLALVPLLPIVFFPPSGERVVTINVNARPGETIDAVLDQAIGVEDLLAPYDVDSYQTLITGAGSDFGAIGNIISGKGANSATITVELGSGDKQQVAEELRVAIAEIPGSENISVAASGGGFGPSENIAFTVAAEDPRLAAEIPAIAEQVAVAIGGVKETANVSTDVGSTQATIQVDVDVEAARDAGLSPASISDQLVSLSSNRTITTANLAEGTLGVRLIVSGGDVQSAEELAALAVAPGVELGDVATLSIVEKPTTITRVDGRPAATISADIIGEDSSAISADALAAVNDLDVPEGIEITQGGIASDINEGFTSMLIAIALSVVLVYGLMALLFQSWLDPFVILFSLPLAIIGAIVALVVTGSPLSISALIGVLMLVGIVVTNAIVMLEFVIMLREERGYDTYGAIIEGAQTRLRPILMTAVAAMLALIPLSLGLTEGALIASDLGRVVIGGLFSSTVLTLVVVPVVYSLVDDWKVWFAQRTHRPLPHGAHMAHHTPQPEAAD